MLLSVIVPVYNVEKYLAKCLDSLLCQDLPSSVYEILVVNDGSTDNSVAIAEHYANQYPQIKLITQPNSGLSAARNTGITQAQGKYIQFVDSDDYLEQNVLGTLVKKMDEDELDILQFSYRNVNEQYQNIIPYKSKKTFVDFPENICDGLVFLTERMGYACYAVQFMIKGSLLKPVEQHFKAGIYFEDTEWTPRILVQAKRVTSVDIHVYNYLFRDGSITRSATTEKKQKVIYDLLLTIDTVINLSNKINNNRINVWKKKMIAFICISILKYTKRNLPEEIPLVITKLRGKKIFPLSLRRLPRNQKIRIMIINISPRFFCWLVK